MADQTVIIGIPQEVVNVPATVTAAIRQGEKVTVSLEPANDGEVIIENSDNGIFITFKKKPFEPDGEIINPPNNNNQGS